MRNSRTILKLDTGLSPGVVTMVSALEHIGVVVTGSGEVYTVTYKKGSKTRVPLPDNHGKKPVRVEKNNKTGCIFHFLLSN